MIAITASQCEGLALESVGLSQSQFGVHSPEFLSAIVRAAAATITPCTRRELTVHILDHLSPLESNHPWREEVREAIAMLIGLGDLVEGQEEENG